ncbi:hypothetical protein VC82_682 [Flagellimonas lutaonensis]|uniref:Secreted protein n=1 Tax=Flagellimonas lutaonensis TaxID=516051 RepID=A0A0D5YR32_9FLAO|nr:hypothetical protein VC82_682 [Allomuricauda lutaonensis]
MLKKCFLLLSIFYSTSLFSTFQSDCYWDFEDCSMDAESHIYGSIAIYGEIKDFALERFIRDLRGCFTSYDLCTK